LRGQEITENNVRIEEMSLEPRKSEAVRRDGGNVEMIFKIFCPLKMTRNKGSKVEKAKLNKVKF
jgi:hypothetical protein